MIDTRVSSAGIAMRMSDNGFGIASDANQCEIPTLIGALTVDSRRIEGELLERLFRQHAAVVPHPLQRYVIASLRDRFSSSSSVPLPGAW